MRLGHGPDASVSQYPTRQFVPSVWVQATYHARVCVTTCYQSSGTLTRTNHIVRCAGLSCPRNYAISGLCKRRTLFVDAFISAIEWPRIPAWCLKLFCMKIVWTQITFKTEKRAPGRSMPVMMTCGYVQTRNAIGPDPERTAMLLILKKKIRLWQ